MSIMRKVAQNSALQLIGKILGTALGFGATLFILRYLGDEQYGHFTTALAYLQMFGILMDLGLYIVLLKHISSPENSDGKLQNNIFSMRLVTAIAFLLVACSLIWFIPSYPLIIKWAVLVVAANFFFITMNQLLMGVYQQHFAMGRVAIAEVLSKAVLFIVTLLVIFVFKAGLLAIMLTVVIGGLTQFLLLWLGTRKYVRLKFAFDRAIWKRIISESWPVAISIGLNLIYFKADTMILSLFRSQTEVGIYGAPYKMLEVMITLPAMIVGLVMPVLGKAYAERNLDHFKHIYEQSFNVLSIIVAPIIVGTIIIAQPFMELVVGSDFTEHIADLGPILQILIFAVGMIFIGTLTGYIIVIIDKQKTMIWGYAFVALTALGGYLYFIPKYSYFGAAGVTVYAETTIMLIALYIIFKTTRILPSIKIPLRILLASLVMGGAIYMVRDQYILIPILVGLAVYPIALVIVRAVSQKDIKSFLQLRSGA